MLKRQGKPLLQNFQNQSQEGNLQQQSKRSILTQEQQESFIDSRQKLVKFIGQVMDESDYSQINQIREQILDHCSFTDKKDYQNQNNNAKEILRLIDIRIQKMVKTCKIKRNWSEQDIKILIWIISKYCDIRKYSIVQRQFTYEDWEYVSALIAGSTPDSCMFKWLKLKKTKITLKNWSQTEANHLKNIIDEQMLKQKDQKFNWKQISEKLYLINQEKDKIFRNQRQCKQHWNCHLNPNLKKGPWEQEQDVLLLKTVKQNACQKKWAQIAKYFNGRTQNALRNRYNLIIQKQKKYRQTVDQVNLIDDYIARCQAQQFTLYQPQDQIQKQKRAVKKAQKTLNDEIIVKFKNDEIFYQPMQNIQKDNTQDFCICLSDKMFNQNQENNCVEK